MVATVGSPRMRGWLAVAGLAGSLACGPSGEGPASQPAAERAVAASEAAPAASPATDALPRRLDGYTARIFKWAYYLIPAGLSQEDLLAQAAAIHAREPDTQLVLVDDESQVKDYIAHAKAVTENRTDVPLPEAWANAHVVANLQKLMSGKWMLYKGYGYDEIGEVK